MGVAGIIVGIIGNVISCSIFLSPAATLYEFTRGKAGEGVQLQSYMFLCSLVSSWVWMFSGCEDGNEDKLLFFVYNSAVNGFGHLYLNVYNTLVNGNDGKKRVFACVLLFEVVLLAVIISVAKLYFHGHTVVFFGIVADAFSIMLYASHVAIWKKLITTKSVECMHFWVSLAGLSKGISWTIYALLYFDLFILVSSGLEAVFGAIYVALYAYFYFHGNNKVTPTEEPISASPL